MKKIFKKIFVRLTIYLSRGHGFGKKFPFISVIYKRIFKIVKENNKPVKVTIPNIGDFQMYVDSEDSLGLSVFGIYEKFETDIISNIIKKNQTVLDIGANIGYYTIILSKLVGDGGMVFAFEPDSENFRILKKNIELNGCKNVIAEQKAIGEKSTRAKLFLNPENKGDHRMFDSGDGRVSADVNLMSIDDYFNYNIPQINFIKIDVQGFELFVLRGMNGILSQNNKKSMIMEFWPEGIALAGENPLLILEILKKNRFSIFELDESHRSKNQINDIDRWYEEKKNESINLLCVKE